MANTYLKGVLGFKGERGYSAYETAVQHGFIGSEQDWLATLGTSSHFTQTKVNYTTTVANETELNLPSAYTINSFLDVYVEGVRLSSTMYTINTSTNKIILTNALEVVGTKVEIVVLTMSTNNLPISDTISSASTNDTASGTKSVYDFVTEEIENIPDPSELINDTTASADKVYSSNKINSLLGAKFNASNIEVLTGSVSNIEIGETKTANVEYPEGFTKSNTIIISKMTSSNNVYYDVTDLVDTTNGFPIVSMISLTDSEIKVALKNTSTSTARIGYYKITIMKID